MDAPTERQVVEAPVAPAAAAPVAVPEAAPVTAGSGGGMPSSVLRFGFYAGIVLSVFCLAIAGYYLLSYQQYATGALERVNASGTVEPRNLMLHMYMARVLLQSCGLAVGMAFGFLGFSLFLLGVGGSMDASAAASGGLGIQVARISPGAFVMLCSAILVGLCATQDIQARMGEGAQEVINSTDAAERYGDVMDGEDPSVANLSDIPPDPINGTAPADNAAVPETNGGGR